MSVFKISLSVIDSWIHNYNLFFISVHGGWGSWGSWGYCPVTCGGGTRYRYRSCNNPTPMYGGYICYGSSSDSVYCNTNGCPGKVLSVIFKEAEKTHWVVEHVSVQSWLCWQTACTNTPWNQSRFWMMGARYNISDISPWSYCSYNEFCSITKWFNCNIYYAMLHKNVNHLNCTLFMHVAS